MNLLKNIQESRKDITLIYFGGVDKHYVQYPDLGLPPGYDCTQRPWFKAAMANKGKVVISDPYISASAKRPTVTISQTVEENGKVVGVVGIDLDLDSIEQQFQSLKIGKDGYMMLVDKNGNIVAHPDKNLLGTNMTKNQNDLWNKISNQDSGYISYQDNNREQRFAAFYTNSETEWKIIATLPASELTDNVNIIREWSVGMIFFFGIISAALAYLFSRRISQNVENIRNAFKRASSGDLSVRAQVK